MPESLYKQGSPVVDCLSKNDWQESPRSKIDAIAPQDHKAIVNRHREHFAGDATRTALEPFDNYLKLL